MKIKIKDKEIESNEIKNIYPSAIVLLENGEKTPISLDWAKENKDKVNICEYAILIIMKDENKKIEIYYESFEEMIESLKLLHEKLTSNN